MFVDLISILFCVCACTDSKEGVGGDISVCGFDINFILCLCLYRLKRKGGGR